MKSLHALALLAGILAASGAARAEVAWEKLADPPRDLLGRECAPGMDGAWVYVPEWRGFLLYGGRSPAHSNGGWFLDPDKREWTPLWANDQLAFDQAAGKWRALLPREMTWSADRPGPAMGHGAVYAPDRKLVYIFGGHPAVGKQGDGRHTRADFYGPTRLGTWALKPAGGGFQPLGEEGPTGMVFAAYDPVGALAVAAPKGDTTWVFSPAGGKWDARKTPGAPNGDSIVYDANARKFLLYDDGRTWSYDAGANAWKDLAPANSPPARRSPALCFDAARGVTVLHGGVTSQHSGYADFEPKIGGKGFNDTWVYDAAKNAWTEIKPAGAPPATLSRRNLCAYDPDRQRCVFYDVAVGAWALGEGGKQAPARSAELPALVRKEAPKAPALDDKARAWQQQLKAMPDDSWLDPGVPHPVMGCMNTAYDPKNRCIVQMGGCGGAMFGTHSDYGYHNQTWLFDMDVGRFLLRRAHHPWGPETEDFIRKRLPAGCTRGACFDSKRGAMWARGGNGQPLLKCPRCIRSYDVAADLFSAAGPSAPTGDGESDQMVYDSRHDLVLATRARSHSISLYSPASNTWSDGGPCPVTMADDLTTYTGKAYDPEVGVIMVCPSPKGWQVGEPRPEKPEWAMRTFAYDAGAKKWRDLAPAGSEQLPLCTIPGIACDSRNRAVIFIKSDHGDVKNSDPAVPYGTLFVLDLAANAWKPGKAGPAEKLNNGAAAYDANHNVVICAFGFRGKFMLYRHKGGCPADAFGGK